MQTPSIQQDKVILFPEESTGTNPADSVTLENNQNFSDSKKEKNKLEKNIEVSDLVLQIQNYPESAQNNDQEEQSKSNIYEEFTILNLILQKQYKQAKEQLLDNVGNLSLKEGSLIY